MNEKTVQGATAIVPGEQGTEPHKVVSHFSKSISQTTTFWKLGSVFFGIRVILGEKLGLYAGVRFWRNVLWRSGVQPPTRMGNPIFDLVL